MTEDNDDIRFLLGAPRAAILRAMVDGEKAVGQIVRVTRLSQPNVSNHLSRLHRQGLVHRRRDGRRIYYRLSDVDVRSLLLRSPIGKPAVDLESTCSAYLEALCEWDLHRAERAVLRARAHGADWRGLYAEVLLPGLRHIGEGWEKGRVPVAHEHAASALTERLIGMLRPCPPHEREETARGAAVIGCAPGDHHAIGGRMTAELLDDSGWRAVFLGANVPVEENLRAIERWRPAAFILSLSVKELEPDALEAIRAIDGMNGRRPALLVGGAVPSETPIPFLAAGVDGIAKSPFDAVEQLDEMTRSGRMPPRE